MPEIPSPLFMLAFDHREVLRELMGRDNEDPAVQQARFEAGKDLVLEALLHAVEGSVPLPHAGFLVDEEYGAAAARRAKREGVVLAMPVEASRSEILEFQYGMGFPQHVEAFDPDIIKLLVFHNPDDPSRRRQIQTERMREISDWAQDHGYPLMLEILIRPTKEQLQAVNGSMARFWAELHPELLMCSVAQFQDAGIEPRLWKVESLPSTEAYRVIAQQCRAGGRTSVGCLILGNGADIGHVEQWISEASMVDGFVGFAVGRSVWLEPLRGYYAGELTQSETMATIEDSSTRLVRAFNSGTKQTS